MNKLPFYIYVFLVGIALSQAVYYYPVMPDVMASHFGDAGKANGWMSREGFIGVHSIVFLGMIGIFILMPLLFKKFRVERMNLPNRDYWLAPERQESTYNYFRTALCWFGVANMILMLGAIQLVFEANFSPPPVLDNEMFLILMGGYFVFVIIWLILFFRKFKKIN